MTVSIELERESWRPGETVQGRVVLSLPEPLEISGIYLQLQGVERVRFRASVRADMNGSCEDAFDSRQRRGSSKRHSQQTVNTGIPTRLPITQPHFLQSLLLTVTLPVTRFRGRLPSGTHSFPFSVLLPLRLPPSLHFSSGNKYLAEVAYEFTVQVFRPHTANAQTITFTSPLRVIGHPKLTPVLPSFIERSIRAQNTLCCFPAQQMDFFASWSESSSFTCGQSIPVQLQILSASTLPSRISVKLVQELVLDISGHAFRHVQPVSKSKFDDFKRPVDLLVPFGLVPSVRTEAVECKYFLVFEIDWRWAETSIIASEIRINE